MKARRYALTLLLSLLAGCGGAPRDAAGIATSAAQAVAGGVEDQQQTAVQQVVPMVLALQDAAAVVVEALPEPAAPRALVSPETVNLIVRWEVTSPAMYTRRYQGVICPGGASGPTVGIGYDFGHQSKASIARDWAGHPDVDRMVTASGVTGEAACSQWRARHRDIRVPFAQAQQVFAQSTLPTYHGMARRAFRDGWERLSEGGQGANVSLVYNRGASMSGSRNREKLHIKQHCVPGGDHPCIAAQLRGMCRIWAGTPNGKGLCARRDDEARLAVT